MNTADDISNPAYAGKVCVTINRPFRRPFFQCTGMSVHISNPKGTDMKTPDKNELTPDIFHTKTASAKAAEPSPPGDEEAPCAALKAAWLNGKRLSFREMAQEARREEHEGHYREAAELWHRAGILAHEPENRLWAEGRHLHCAYMGRLRSSHIPAYCRDELHDYVFQNTEGPDTSR